MAFRFIKMLQKISLCMWKYRPGLSGKEWVSSSVGIGIFILFVWRGPGIGGREGSRGGKGWLQCTHSVDQPCKEKSRKVFHIADVGRKLWAFGGWWNAHFKAVSILFILASWCSKSVCSLSAACQQCFGDKEHSGWQSIWQRKRVYLGSWLQISVHLERLAWLQEGIVWWQEGEAGQRFLPRLTRKQWARLE